MYIYVITHPKFKGWIKLGRSINIVNRLENYQTYCPDRDFKLEFSIKTEYVYIIEVYFANNVPGNREWYKCSAEFAIKTINETIDAIAKNENYYSDQIQTCGKLHYIYIVDNFTKFERLEELLDYTKISQGVYYKNLKKSSGVMNINGYEIIRCSRKK